MKILHIISSLNLGGAEKMVVNLANSMAKEGYEVTILVLFSFTDRDGLLLNNISSSVRLISLSKQRGEKFSPFFRLIKILKKYHPDVIHTHDISGVYVWMIFWKYSSKCFHTVHSDIKSDGNGRMIGWIKRTSLKYLGLVPILVSNEYYEDFKVTYGVSPKVIPNGVFIKRAERVEETKIKMQSALVYQNPLIVLNVAGIKSIKNQKVLCMVFQRLYNENKNIELFIIGDESSYETGLKEQLLSICSPNTHFINEVANIEDYYSCAKIICLTSLSEGLSLSLLEGMSVGLIPLITPIPSLRKIVEGSKLGFVAEDFSVDAIQKEFEKILLLGEEEINNLSANNKEYIYQNHSYGFMLRSYMDQYGS